MKVSDLPSSKYYSASYTTDQSKVVEVHDEDNLVQDEAEIIEKDPLKLSKFLALKRKSLLKDLYSIFFAEECQAMWEPLNWRDQHFKLTNAITNHSAITEEAAAFG